MAVKLTEEQAEIIKNVIKTDRCEEAIHNHVNGALIDELQPLSLSEFIKCLYMQDYEIEEEFKEGDWVIRTVNKGGPHYKHRTFLVSNINYYGFIEETNKYGQLVTHVPDSIRHATESEIQQEKERRFWAVLGREVNEFKNRDIVKIPSGNTIELKGFIGFDNINVNELRLICPKENRLDVSQYD